MKKLVLLFLIAVVFSSCKKLTEFTVSDTAEFTIPSTSSLGVPVNNSVSVATSSNTEFKANGGDIKNVKEIRLIKLLLTTVQPSAQTFSFLNSIHIFISADDLPETEIAYLENIPSDVGNSIDLVTTGAVLDDYIKPGFLNREILPNENPVSLYQINDYTD
jgi:hypothetical protein